MPRKPVTFTIARLVELTGENRWWVRRMLDRAGVQWLSTDPRVVTLAELRRCAPDLWDSIVEARTLTGT